MKKIIFCIMTFLSLNMYGEKIENFYYNVSVNEDKSLHIVETIDYNPEGQMKHGITRDILTKNADYKFFKFESNIGLVNFRSNFESLSKNQGKYTSFRLGSPNSYLPTNKITRFIIEYDLYNVIRTEDTRTQIYLNATGNFWNMPIENVEIKLELKPSAIKELYVYTGVYGKNTNNFEIVGKDKIININPLSKYEGMTFKVNLDNVYYKYTLLDKINNVLVAYPSIKINVILGLISIFVILLSLIKKMRNKDNIPIVPEFKVDDKISAAMCQKIYGKSKYDPLTIVFLSLASKGVIKEQDYYMQYTDYVIKKGEKINPETDYEKIPVIEEEKKYSLIDDKELEKIISDKSKFSPEELHAVSRWIGQRDDIFANYSNIAKVNENVINIIDKIYRLNLGEKYIPYFLISILSFVVLIIVNILISFELNTLMISGIINLIAIILSSNILILTEEGKKAYRNVKGFVMYFDKVETNIFKTLQTKKEIIDYAKKMLPYAVAVGIEAKFIDLLNKELSVRNIGKENIYPYIYYSYFVNRHIINNKIGYLISENNRIANTNTNHSSGGGFSGGSGGFSGGGFSGGGGSSW
ncbi:DUF2207 domain-containing protein [Oceanivirga salmonicida]|uniref:DUF2207 domain-containing protein n=1 Tax=Oceanivirga salmonicida TaxID=1769291 RepID=UPI0018CC1CD2|nr:DUF2207 domain-containing protein [Oceanivirga salmonicida]